MWFSLVQQHEMNKEESIQPQLYVGFNVFKLSIDYEELLKETNQIPAVIIRCLQRVRKVRFTVVKAQIFLTLTYDDYIILISTL